MINSNGTWAYTFILGLHVFGLVLSVALCFGILWQYFFLASNEAEGVESVIRPTALFGLLAGNLGLFLFVAAGFRHTHAIAQEREKFELDRKIHDFQKEQQNSLIGRMAAEEEIRSQTAQRVSASIADYLSKDHGWVETALTNAQHFPFQNTKFYNRSHHYSREKEILGLSFARLLVNDLVKHARSNKFDRIYVLVDSGSTLVPFLEALSLSFRKSNEIKRLMSQVRVVTNNLAGADAFLFPEGNELAPDELVPLHILPGRPNATYRAITSPQATQRKHTEDYLKALIAKKRDDVEHKTAGRRSVKVISVVTGNWIGLRAEKGQMASPLPRPFARGDGHLEIKEAMVAEADIAYVVTPLAKIILQKSTETYDEFNNLLRRIEKRTAKSEKFEGELYKELSNVQETPLKLVTTDRVGASFLDRFCGQVSANMNELNLPSGFPDTDLVPGFLSSDPNWSLLRFPLKQVFADDETQKRLEFPHAYSRDDEFLELFDIKNNSSI